MRRLLLTTTLGLLVSLAIGVREASACTCMPAATPCATFQSSDPNLQIFVGTPTSVRSVGQDVVRFTFAVSEGLKGTSTGTVEIETLADSAACGYPFRVGAQYLVYAQRAGQVLFVSLCSRTGPLASRQDDLNLFKEIAAGRVQSRLNGAVLRSTLTLDGFYLHDEPGLTGVPGVPVTVRGPGATREIRTDKDGAFNVVGLPAGAYTIDSQLPPPLIRRFDGPITVTLDGCLAETAIFVAPLSIGGVLRMEDGRPVGKSAMLRAARLGNDNTVAFNRTTLAFTEANGQWSFAGLPPGRYLVGVNVYDAPSVHTPYEAVWYPRAGRPADATVIDVTDAASRTIDFRLPASLPTVTISGRVVDQSGQPHAKASVLLYDDEDPRARGFKTHTANATTDEMGRFTITGFAGHRYVVEAMTSFAVGRPGGKSQPTPVSAEAPTDVTIAIPSR